MGAMNSTQYTDELEEFIVAEMLPAYIESKVRNGMDPNQSYVVGKLLAILKTKPQKAALMRKKFALDF